MPWGRRYDGDPQKYWFEGGLGTTPFHSCHKARCLITNNLSDSDAVLISVNRLVKWYKKFKLPQRPSPKQKWIFYAWESPQRFPIKQEYLKQTLFNATFTYKKSSDIYYPYGRIVERTDQWTLKYNDTWSRKQNVAWIASSGCHLGRRRYVQELSKHIDVTIMGKCSRRKCPGDDTTQLPWAPCFKHIQKNFKFYLAFENSACDEYVTEKLWRTLRMHVIPIVYGKPKYKDFLPHKSVIDIRDFLSPKHLAYYLKQLSNDPQLYANYFHWKKQFKSFQNTFPEATCRLCEYLHQTRHDPPKSIDLNIFWNSEEDCTNSNDFLRAVGVL